MDAFTVQHPCESAILQRMYAVAVLQGICVCSTSQVPVFNVEALGEESEGR